MRLPIYLAAIFLMSACAAPPTLESEVTSKGLEDWYREEITMPPQFAPRMPAGEEILLFAPGMFDAEAEDFWSYVFLMQVEESSMSEQRILEIFELYYDGLIIAVAEDRNEDVGDDPATVQMQVLGHGVYEMQIDLIDSFVTMEELHLNLIVEALPLDSGGTVLRVRASPKAKEHQVWLHLNQALRSLQFEN
ncbi:MAG: hypothetical protein O3A95_07105 [Planctomycetota bacterium]|nr:hypothetical protein [Planctomycetota bacterium]MDA1114051.1 hypothetical protein [Planctomycetota bacterium]